MYTTYPRRELTDEDLLKTLSELGLAPSSTLVVAVVSHASTPQHQHENSFSLSLLIMSLILITVFIDLELTLQREFFYSGHCWGGSHQLILTDDDFLSGSRNFSQCHHQQSFSEPLSPGRLNHTNDCL